MAELDPNDPRAHTALMEKRFKETINELRSEIKTLQDPRAKALFETAAEEIGGLENGFHGYGKGDRPAWSRRSAGRSRARGRKRQQWIRWRSGSSRRGRRAGRNRGDRRSGCAELECRFGWLPRP